MVGMRKKSGKMKPKLNISVKKGTVVALVKKGIPVVIMLGCVTALILGVRAIFVNIPYFKIESINVVAEEKGFAGITSLRDSERLKLYKGKNIFTVNLKKLSQAIGESYPDLDKAVVRRIMPNILEIELSPRIPLARIKSFGSYPVDGEGMILSSSIKLSHPLPVVTGVSMWKRAKVGRILDSSRLRLALTFLKQIKGISAIQQFGVQRIDVSNTRNLLLFLGNDIEVRIGQGGFSKKLGRLKIILQDPNINKDNLEYIDLRFKEAVLGPR